MSRFATIPDQFNTLRHPDFFKLFVSKVATTFGFWLTYFALFTIYVFETEVGPLAVGLLGIVQIVPKLIGSPVLSVFTDQFSRRKLLIIAELAGGAIVVCFVAVESLVVAYVGLFLLGIVSSVSSPAHKALRPQVIENEEELAQANALMSSASSTAQLIGPGLAGALILFVEPKMLFIADAASFAFSAFMIFSMAEYSVDPEDSDSGLRTKFSDGFSYLVRTSGLVFPIATGVVLFATMGIYDSLLPIFVRESLQLGPAALGLITSVTAGGALISGIMVAGFGDRYDPKKAVLVAMFLNGIVIYLLSWKPIFNVALVATFLLGFATTMSLTYLTTIIQQESNESFMGRVFGFYSGLTKMGQITFISIGSIFASQFNIIFTFRGVGVGLLLLATGGTLFQLIDIEGNLQSISR